MLSPLAWQGSLNSLCEENIEEKFGSLQAAAEALRSKGVQLLEGNYQALVVACQLHSIGPD